MAVSIVIPKKVIACAGPSVLFGATGTPSISQTARAFERASVHSDELGPPSTKKSSK